MRSFGVVLLQKLYGPFPQTEVESPTEYINAISKLLPYSIGKVKAYEEIEEFEPREIKITFVDTDGVERDKLI